MAKVIDQDGKELAWVAIFMRYHHEYQEECEDLEDALGMLCWGQERGDLRAVRVVSPSGEVLEGADLDRAITAYRDEPEEAHAAIEPARDDS